MRIVLAGLIATLAVACAPEQEPPRGARSAPRPTAAPAASAPAGAREAPPLGRLPRDVHPVHQALSLDVDPSKERFGGSTEIDLELDRPRDVIWLHGRGLSVASAAITTPSGERVAASFQEVDPSGVARVSLPRPIGPGKATLRVVFDAPYDPQLVGVYRAKVGGRFAVVSKFEAIYARRGFPCFDEPSFKATFDVALDVPPGEVAVGNMPIAEETPLPGGARKRVRFATTPPLPTYLVAFAVGPFESRTATMAPAPLRAKPLPVGVVSVAGRGADAAYALGVSPPLIAEQERYFGVAFPFPKVDLVAVPDFQSGAMENAGAITFRDSFLLVDDKTGTLAQRIGVTKTVAHELAHQWFGDLVTMRWWDDIWLNEGFASFMATRTVRALHPELEAEVDALQRVDTVMYVDGLAAARRVRQPIESTHDITNAFDGITYEKGEAVLTMLEHYLGEETFRRGVHRFLEAFAGRNATTDDLVAALAAESGQDLAPLVSSFVDQPGVPKVAARAACRAGKGAVDLEQSRWLPAGSDAPKDATWRVPVCVRAGIAGRVEVACGRLDARTGAIDLPGCADWIMPNADAAGYYRFTLDGSDLARLRDRGVARLSTAERLALAENIDAGLRSGSLTSGDALKALEPLARDAHGTVAAEPLDLFRSIDDFVIGDDMRAVWRAYVARLYAPAAAALGWRSSAAEKPWRRLFRAKLLTFLALSIEAPSVLDEAARLGRRYIGLDADGAIHADAVDAELAGLALAAAARKGDARVFDALVAHLTSSTDAPTRNRMLAAIASVRAPSLVEKALDLALDPRLRQNERLTTITPLLGSVATHDAAWTWLKAHFDALAPLLPDRYGGTLPAAARICDRARTDDLRAFFASRVEKLTGGPRNLAQALERAGHCAAEVAAQRDGARAFLRAAR